MNTNIINNTRHMVQLFVSNKSLRAKLILVLFTVLTFNAPAQGPYTRPSWFFGVAGGANFNFYRGTTQVLNESVTVPTAFHNGFGTGLFVAPLIEFHQPAKSWGFMIQGGLDSRKAKYEKVTNPCNCPADLAANLNYFTVEPSVRFAPAKGNFYLFAGPRMAFNLNKAFTYGVGKNPEYPNQPLNPDIKGDFSNVNKNLISGQIGAGYDIYLSSNMHRTQWVLSPFVAFHPYYGQDPRSTESLNITTLRAGLALKLGRGHNMPDPKKEVVKKDEPVVEVIPVPTTSNFSVTIPRNVPVIHRTRETFPIRNYIFFDLGSTDIPERYVLLRKSQVSDFKIDQLEVFTPKSLTGRASRQMTVYYNILNILGDRMGKTPDATIVLVGSSEKGPDDARAMAQSVKIYLVNVFGISESRIAVEGLDKPKIPSEQPGGVNELELLREGDRRVSIESSSPALLLEFTSGPDAPLKPVEIVEMKEPIDSSISFKVENASVLYTSWTVELKDDKGAVQTYGPFYKDEAMVPVGSILGTKPDGDYSIILTAKTKEGKTVKKATSAHIVNYTPPRIEEGMRYSVLFEFNESKTIALYDKYLTEVVTPKIPMGGTVIIHGHSDNIGDDVYNQSLSLARAYDVRSIIEKALAAKGRTDVKFEVLGYGEDTYMAPFNNKYPEERFYNRTVVLDIIPTR